MARTQGLVCHSWDAQVTHDPSQGHLGLVDLLLELRVLSELCGQYVSGFAIKGKGLVATMVVDMGVGGYLKGLVGHLWLCFMKPNRLDTRKYSRLVWFYFCFFLLFLLLIANGLWEVMLSRG